MKQKIYLLCFGLILSILPNTSYAYDEQDKPMLAYNWIYHMISNLITNHEQFQNQHEAIKQGVMDALENKPNRYSDEQIETAMAKSPHFHQETTIATSEDDIEQSAQESQIDNE